ncbi:MAG: BON domain-containing protein, partial [Elusimicrobia bacterium]|nr:BON domain-containing protein [Elusimicrobiota bacterium]MBD3412040.1 BON domain-containing protein [Elusimicrobiota bacterium]
IEQKLLFDPYVSHKLIHVSVNEGDVALAGSVGSLAEKRFARRDAWVTGVNTVDASGLSVEWWLEKKDLKKHKQVYLPDHTIKNAVTRALLFDPRVSAHTVTVSVEQGIVDLGGIVADASGRRAAIHNARNTEGVVGVNNYIKIRPVDPPSNGELISQVKSVLDNDYELFPYDLAVSVINQKAYLYGTVDTHFQRFRAGDVVRNVYGIVTVANHINVRNTFRTKTDEEIAGQIKDNFYWDVFIDEDDISVSVEDGMATLTGEAGSWNEFYAAIDNAFKGGARRVYARMNVHGFPGYYPEYDYTEYYERYWP